MNEYSIVVPDMMGYGRSSSTASGDYSMESQIRRLWRLVDLLHFGSTPSFPS